MSIPVALLWFINENGELLTTQRSFDTDTDPGVWGQSVSGAIEDGEDPISAVKRETQEELGFNIDDYDPVYIYSTAIDHPDGKGVRQLNFYYINTDSTVIHALSPNPTEVADVKWIKLQDLELMQQTRKNEVINATLDDFWQGHFAHLRQILTS